MAYIRTDWINGSSGPSINQSNLKKIEDGIYNLHQLDAVIKDEITQCNNDINTANDNIESSTSSADSANILSTSARSYSDDANERSSSANINSNTANSNSLNARDTVDYWLYNPITGRYLSIYDFPDYINNFCINTLCKVVDDGTDICKYSNGIFAIKGEGNGIIEEPEDPDPLLGN